MKIPPLLGAFLLLSPLSTFSSAVPAGGDNDESLASLPIPLPPALGEFVRDRGTAILLGKALFWDEQVGSDGRVACATCHFAGGADIRFERSIHPGDDGVFQEGGTRFPFESDDILGSQGVPRVRFEGVVPGRAVELGTPETHPFFGNGRQVTERNAQSVVNAVFYDAQFWDGRAANVFNGVTPGGRADGDARVLRASSDGSVAAVRVAIEDASLASQAVGPVLTAEMTYTGRTFFDVGKKMLSLRPLALQQVHPDDSVLGRTRSPSGVGLEASYVELIQRAFHRRWWDSDAIVDRDLRVVGRGTPVGRDQFSVMEANFSLYWGLAILMYESTLVSDRSSYDRFLEGDREAMSLSARRGMEVYFDEGRCDACHGEGPELSNASMLNGGNGRAFVNTGVRPVGEDPGMGDGEFKAVTPRVTELNGPYFHTGGYLTLRQVVDFYDRGGDFPNDNTDSQVRRLGLSEQEKTDLVSFLLALTDERVRLQEAPFDHPSLDVPDGPFLPAVGRAGGTPLPSFLDADPYAR